MASDNWLVNLLGDKTPPNTNVGPLKAIDPLIALSFPKIYNYKPSDIKQIEGHNYLIVDIDKKAGNAKNPAYIKAIDIDTGNMVSLLKNETMPILEQGATELSRETLNKVNGQINLHNQRINEIDQATSNLTLLPLQLKRASDLIVRRVDDLNGIISATQSKMDAPKPESIGNWEEEIRNVLLTGDLNEVDFVDTVLQNYLYRYDELVSDLESGSLIIPANIADPEALKAKLTSIGNVAFDSYVASLEKRKEESDRKRSVQDDGSANFDINEFNDDPLQPLELDDMPRSYKSKGYRSYDAYKSSFSATIASSNMQKQGLEKIQSSLDSLASMIGNLGKGERSNNFLKNTDEGQAVVNSIRDFANQKLSPFVAQYKKDIVGKSGKVDQAKLGRGGSVGNATLVVTFSRLYKVLAEMLRKLDSGEEIAGETNDQIEQARTSVNPSVGQDEMQEPEGNPVVSKSKKDKSIEKLSSALWTFFDDRMTPKF